MWRWVQALNCIIDGNCLFSVAKAVLAITFPDPCLVKGVTLLIPNETSDCASYLELNPFKMPSILEKLAEAEVDEEFSEP